MKPRGMKLNRVLQGMMLIIIALLAGCPLLLAQAQRAIISGRVQDSSGAAMPGVEVKVIQKSTNVVWATLTNESGHYEVPGLFPSTYRIVAAYKGFKTSTIDNVDIASAQRAEVNIQMQVGEVSQSVTVTAHAALLDTASADVSTIFASKNVGNLPIGQGNTTFSLMQLAMGADDASGQTGGNGRDNQPMQRAGTGSFRFNGSPGATTEFTIDGSPNSQRGNSGGGAGSSAFNPSPEVVEEMRVQTAIFDASQGHSGGATLDLTLKAGTNDYHGSAVWYHREAAWNAKSWNQNAGGIAKPPVEYGLWDVSAGGPIRLPFYNGKGKTFFYYGFEKWFGLTPNPPTHATVPTAAQLQGNFSGLLALGSKYQLYDPDTAYVASNGRIARLPFTGNIIPSNRINNAVPTAMAKLWPAPNVTGSADGLLNYSYFDAPIPRKLWASTVRVDHNVSDRNKLFARDIWSDTLIPYAGMYASPSVPFSQQFGLNRDEAVSDVWTFSPSFIGDFRIADMRFVWNYNPTGMGMPYSLFGFGYITNLFDTTVAGIPNVGITGYNASVASSQPGTAFTVSGGSHQVSEIRTAIANFTKIHGNHSIRFGGDIRYYIDNRGSSNQLSTNFTGAYSSGPYDNSASPPIGAGLADFLLGKYANATLSQPGQVAGTATYQALYIQDDWKVMPRLTLNLGVRYEREGPASERYNRTLAGFAYNVDNPIAAAAKAAYAKNPIPEIPAAQFQVQGGVLFAGQGGVPRTVYLANNTNFNPRIGLAYQIRSQLVFRGGYGIFFIPYGQRFIATAAPGYSTNTYSYSTLDGGLTFPGTLNNLFPSGAIPATGSSLGLQTFLGQALSMNSEVGNLPNAYNQRWQGGIEMVLANKYKLEVMYVGSRTVKMPLSRSINALPDQYLSTLPTRDQATINNLTTLVSNPFYGISNVGGSLGTSKTMTKATLLVPYPEFGSITVNTNQGWGTYNALQAQLTRRVGHGLTFQTNYTHARTTEASEYLNAADALPWGGPSAINRPNLWRFFGVWELPNGKGGQKRFVGRLASGWQVEAISYAQSGAPITWAGNVLFTGDINSIGIRGQTPERMFNTAGFNTIPAQQLSNNLRTFPNRLLNVTYPWDFGTDLSLIKNTSIWERAQVQIRAESYNVLNQHNFSSGIDTTPTDSTFGSTSLASVGRVMQLGVRFTF